MICDEEGEGSIIRRRGLRGDWMGEDGGDHEMCGEDVNWSNLRQVVRRVLASWLGEHGLGGCVGARRVRFL